MFPDYFKTLLFLLLAMQNFCFVLMLSAEIEEDDWEDPDAWARNYLDSVPSPTVNDKCCKCSDNIIVEQPEFKEPPNKQCQTATDDVASLIYFKKFVTVLFNRKHFQYDSTQQLYERSIVFSIQSRQMDKLEESHDPRDLDNILFEILNNVRTPNMYTDGQQQLYTSESSNGLKAIVLNIIYDVLQLTNISEIRFLLVVAIIVLIAWIINTRFKIGWLFLVFGGIFIYGYLHTYLECNRELQLNQMLEVLNRDNGSEQNAKGSKIINFFKELFNSKDAHDLQKLKIKQASKLSLGFCRPDHVLIIYFNDIFLKYIQVLIEQCTVTLTTLNGALRFPYNILSGLLLVCLIGYVIKLTFKYIFSPSAWMQLLHRKKIYQLEQEIIKGKKNSQADRVSGDNLKLLLNAINVTTQRIATGQKSPPAASVSGVEDVREAIENVLENSLLLDETEAKKHENNNLIENPLDLKS